jgi:hypothetical protein
MNRERDVGLSATVNQRCALGLMRICRYGGVLLIVKASESAAVAASDCEQAGRANGRNSCCNPDIETEAIGNVDVGREAIRLQGFSFFADHIVSVAPSHPS